MVDYLKILDQCKPIKLTALQFCKNIPILRKYTLKYIGVRGYDICNFSLRWLRKKFMYTYIYYIHKHTHRASCPFVLNDVSVKRKSNVNRVLSLHE